MAYRLITLFSFSPSISCLSTQTYQYTVDLHLTKVLMTFFNKSSLS